MHLKKPTLKRALTGILFSSVLLLGSQVAYAEYEKYGVGDTVTVGEFVYEDDFTPSIVDCFVSVYNPSGSVMVNEATTSTTTSGWHWYNYAIPGAGPLGVWPATISCGTLLAGDLVKMDKSFAVGATIESASTSLAAVINANTNTATANIASAINANTDIKIATASSSLFASLPAAIWSYTSRTLSSFGTLAADVWTNSVRTLTGAGLDTGSLATASDVSSASTSVVALVNANTNSQTSGITSAVNNNTNSVVASASSSVVALVNANT
ncbi:MAG: hypothetical protein RLZZ67_221, partial [Candidatus Parcubacteria bacterium]